VCGILAVQDASADAAERRYLVSAGAAEVLLDRGSLNHLAPLSRAIVGCIAQMRPLLEAFRTGGGVPWEQYGADVREAQADLNRPQFLTLLGTEWLTAIPDVHARLLAEPPARVADIACGAGWSSIAIAQAYPHVRVDGFDTDEAAIELACANAQQAGVADRVRFSVHDAGDPSLSGRYDLVAVFEAIHDMSRPVEALQTMLRLVADGGAVLVMDERVGERFTAPGDDVERFMYGWSVLLCLPTGMAEQPSEGTGTVMRADTLRGYAARAGFGRVEVLPIEHDFFRFYRLHG
jgi:SAM-dependent methyltransferase